MSFFMIENNLQVFLTPGLFFTPDNAGTPVLVSKSHCKRLSSVAAWKLLLSVFSVVNEAIVVIVMTVVIVVYPGHGNNSELDGVNDCAITT